jgi:hypothetical protein
MMPIPKLLSLNTTLPPELPAGEYRFRVALYLMDQEELRDQVSDGFVIDS